MHFLIVGVAVHAGMIAVARVANRSVQFGAVRERLGPRRAPPTPENSVYERLVGRFFATLAPIG